MKKYFGMDDIKLSMRCVLSRYPCDVNRSGSIYIEDIFETKLASAMSIDQRTLAGRTMDF